MQRYLSVLRPVIIDEGALARRDEMPLILVLARFSSYWPGFGGR